MTAVLWVSVAVIALPAFALALWPLFRRGAASAERGAGPTADDDRRIELSEEKASLYRALKEIEFDYDAGHLSEEDYRPLRDRYEGRAAAVIQALDALGPVSMPQGRVGRGDTEAASEAPAAGRRGWTKHPAALVGGSVLLLLFGLLLGLGVGRFTEKEPAAAPSGGRAGVPDAPAAAGGPGMPGMPGMPGDPAPEAAPGEPAGAIAPEVMARMLQAARQSLQAGQYQQAISAYQAVLKREPRNVDAMTHLGLIVAIGGHGDSALESFGKALAIDPNYAPAYLYRGQVLYDVKQDYAGAIKAWERFMVLVPRGEEHDQVKALIEKARSQRPAAQPR
ncbi:MAG: tetratricopeptide repeat protein [Candidatus Rokubacteria bacterium]|nr:tetratricopeptide repeat protein [Candidatus Rokubacteria bacterium]